MIAEKATGYEVLAETSYCGLLLQFLSNHDIDSGVRIICDEESFLN